MGQDYSEIEHGFISADGERRVFEPDTPLVILDGVGFTPVEELTDEQREQTKDHLVLTAEQHISMATNAFNIAKRAEALKRGREAAIARQAAGFLRQAARRRQGN